MPLSTQERMYIEQRIANDAKSPVIAYLLWFFFGGLGVHRIYLGRAGSGIFMALLTAAGLLLLMVVFGLVLLAFVALWWIVDAFLIPGMVDAHKSAMRRQLEDRTGATNGREREIEVDTSRWSAKDRAEHQRKLLAAAAAPPAAEPAAAFGWRIVNGERRSFTQGQFAASLEALRKPITQWEMAIRRLERLAEARGVGPGPGPDGAEEEVIALLNQIDEAAAKYSSFVRTLSFGTGDAYDEANAFAGEYDRLAQRLAILQDRLAVMSGRT